MPILNSPQMSLMNAWEPLCRPPKYDVLVTLSYLTLRPHGLYGTLQTYDTCKSQLVLLCLLGRRDKGKVSALHSGEPLCLSASQTLQAQVPWFDYVSLKSIFSLNSDRALLLRCGIEVG